MEKGIAIPQAIRTHLCVKKKITPLYVTCNKNYV